MADKTFRGLLINFTSAEGYRSSAMPEGLETFVRVMGWLYVAFAVLLLAVLILQFGFGEGNHGWTPHWKGLAFAPLGAVCWPLIIPAVLTGFPHRDPRSRS